MQNLLKSHTVKEIKTPTPVFFTTEDSFTKAFQSLVTNKILSAPLLDLKTNHFVGFLDIRDVISMTLVVFEKCMSHSAGQTVESLDQLLARVWCVRAFGAQHRHQRRFWFFFCARVRACACARAVAVCRSGARARGRTNLQQENNSISLEYLARRNPFISVDETAVRHRWFFFWAALCAILI